MPPDGPKFLVAIAVRTLLVLLALVISLRLLGKRQSGQFNIYDLALIMLLANAVQNAMTNGDGHLLVGVVSAGTLLAAGWWCRARSRGCPVGGARRRRLDAAGERRPVRPFTFASRAHHGGPDPRDDAAARRLRSVGGADGGARDRRHD